MPEDGPLASLVNYETMAIGSFNASGSSTVDEWTSGGGQFNDSGSGSTPVYFKLGIKDGIVNVELPRLAPDVTFKGTLGYRSQ